jgi:hypothetical protein
MNVGEAQRVICGRGRAHHDRGDVRAHFVRDGNRIERGDDDAIRVAAVALLAEHLARRTELLAVAPAARALAATDEVVQRDTLAYANVRHVLANGGDDARDLVAEGDREIRLARARTVMRVGVADARALDVDDDLIRGGSRVGEECCLGGWPGSMSRMACMGESYAAESQSLKVSKSQRAFLPPSLRLCDLRL